LLEAALKNHPPVHRYAAAAAVVSGQQNVGSDHDVVLGERPRVDASLVSRLAGVAGVRAAIADVSVPAQLGSRSAQAHGWGSSPAPASPPRACRPRLPETSCSRARLAARPSLPNGRPIEPG